MVRFRMCKHKIKNGIDLFINSTQVYNIQKSYKNPVSGIMPGLPALYIYAGLVCKCIAALLSMRIILSGGIMNSNFISMSVQARDVIFGISVSLLFVHEIIPIT